VPAIEVDVNKPTCLNRKRERQKVRILLKKRSDESGCLGISEWQPAFAETLKGEAGIRKEIAKKESLKCSGCPREILYQQLAKEADRKM